MCFGKQNIEIPEHMFFTGTLVSWALDLEL